MRIFLSLAITFLVSSLFAESIVYLVYKNKDSGLVSKSKGKGYEKSRQPIENTETLTSPNTNYYLLFVTPINGDGKNYFKGLEQSGQILRISETKIETVHNDQRGGDETHAITIEINPLPKDFYQDWTIPIEVKVSSK